MDAAMRIGDHFLALAAMAAAVTVALTAGGCASQSTEPVPLVQSTLSVWNRAQSELLELRLHGSEGYFEATNLLAAPLASETSVDVAFLQGQYVTVLRCRVADDDPMAFTTARGLHEVDGDGYTLVVFDKSFRLLGPGQ
jgi:hypothetical protein